METTTNGCVRYAAGFDSRAPDASSKPNAVHAPRVLVFLARVRRCPSAGWLGAARGACTARAGVSGPWACMQHTWHDTNLRINMKIKESH